MESTQIAGTGDTVTPHEQWCVLYDRRTGAVVHLHQYIALSGSDQALSQEELATQAVEQALQATEGTRLFEKYYVNVAHPADDMPLDYSKRYSVDLESGRIRYEAVES